MNHEIKFSKEKKQLLKALTEIELPIVIIGKAGTGKSAVSRVLMGFSDRNLFDQEEHIMEGERLFTSKEDLVGFEDYNNFILVPYGENYTDKLKSLGVFEYVLVKCSFDKEDCNFYFNVSLIKKDIHMVEKFSNTVRLVVLDGEESDITIDKHLSKISNIKHFKVGNDEELKDLLHYTTQLKGLASLMRNGFIEGATVIPTHFKIDFRLIKKAHYPSLNFLFSEAEKLNVYLTFTNAKGVFSDNKKLAVDLLN